jgi:hypothetical protein
MIFCDQVNEHLGCIKCNEFLEQLSDYQLHKLKSGSCGYLGLN